MMDEEQLDEERYEEFSRFLREAVGEALRLEDGEAFLAWMREEAPRRRAGGVRGAARRRGPASGLATELGRALWNALPLPGNGFRPRPIPQARAQRSLPVRLRPQVQEVLRRVGGRRAGARAGGGLDAGHRGALPGDGRGAGGVRPGAAQSRGPARRGLLDDGDALRALALVRPLFERPERLDERDAASLNTLLEAYEALDLDEERWEAAERLARELRPPLRAVLWENLARAVRRGGGDGGGLDLARPGPRGRSGERRRSGRSR